MNLIDIHRAVEYFKAKMEFTAGPVELKQMLVMGEEINIIDVRYPEDYLLGHIPSSINLPKDDWETFDGLSPDDINVFYGYSGVCHLAAAAAMFFASHGYPVMELDGGFEQWRLHQFPIEM
ncbi:MAG: rhodanese-like domain-containing protein [Planctomycetota bacterium]|jgi:rhodanese-related sulfurtransferase